MNVTQQAICLNTAAHRAAVRQLRLIKHCSRPVTAQQCSSLPSIRDFILSECPLPGTDGFGYRERPKTATLTTSCVVVDQASLLVPGQRRLFSVSEVQLQQIIQDKGQVVICCCEDSDVFKLSTPPRGGSYCCLAVVVGLQRMSQPQQQQQQQALVRVVVTDRVAVQSVDCSDHDDVIRCQSALLRDRWTYRIRTEAVQQYCNSSSSDVTTGRSHYEVTTVVDQLQDVLTELHQVLDPLNSTVQQLTDDDAGRCTVLQQRLLRYEAAEELQHIMGWVIVTDQQTDSNNNNTSSNTGGSSSSSDHSADTGIASSTPSSPDHHLLDRAWRFSFAPYAATGLIRALADGSNSGGSSNSNQQWPALDGSAQVLGMSDLGLRLESALDLSCELRGHLAAQLALS